MRTLLGQSAALLAANVSINITTPSLGFPQQLQQFWAQSTPWFPVATYVPPPAGCEIVQVNLLQRHGARYPTPGPGSEMQKSVNKMKNATEFQDENFEFIRRYNYTLGTNDLVPFGAAQSFDAGQEYFVRYADLVNETMLPFVRASSSDRVHKSALNWTAGFAYASNYMLVPQLSVIISESTSKDTLDNDCPAAASSRNQTIAWDNVYAPLITSRFNSVAPGANVTNSDIVNLMSLCPYDTVAHETTSPWCNLFSSDEWPLFEYHGDLDDYYGNGYGNKLGPVQGVGWINELLARLTGQSVRDETQTNHTLDKSPVTFPLNLTFYADFTHDNEMISIYSAMGLYNQSQPLDPLMPDPNRSWVVSRMVPFSSRLVAEKLVCEGKQDEYVRILVNDGIQDLTFCGGDSDGLCSVPDFVASQTFARENGRGLWPSCFKTS